MPPPNTQQKPFIKPQTNPPPTFNPDNYGVLPVYDSGNFLEILRFYLNDPTAVLQAVTNSTLNARANRFTSSGATGAQPIKDLDTILTNTDSMPLANYGANTDMNQTFIVEVPQNCFLSLIKCNIGFGSNVSVAGAGTVTFSSIRIQFINQATGSVIYDTGVVNTGLTGIAAGTGAQLFYFNQDIFPPNADNRLLASTNVVLKITTTSTDSGAATRQMGIYPTFSPQGQTSPASAIQYTYSFIDLYVYPTLDSATQVMNDFTARKAQTIRTGLNVDNHY